MWNQRKGGSRQFERRVNKSFWSPQIDFDDGFETSEEPGETDWYAVVDEISGGVARLEVAPWPEVDVGGHLRFENISEISLPLNDLQQLANSSRVEAGQPVPQRQIRIGDAFWIRNPSGFDKADISGEFVGTIRDVTRAARKQAKIAMYGAVTQAIDPDEGRKRRLESKDSCRFRRPSRVSTETGVSLADSKRSAGEE